MNATLFNVTTLAHIEAAMQANRDEAADIVPDVLRGDEDAGKRMNQLNEAYVALQWAHIEAGGPDPAPYRMRR